MDDTLTDHLSSHCTYVLSLHWTYRFRLHNAVMLLNYVLRSMRYLEQRTCIATEAAAETTTSSAHSTVSATLSLHIRLHGSTASSVSMGIGIDMQSEDQQEQEEDIHISSIPFDCMVFPCPAIGRRFLQYLVSTYYE